MKARFGLREIQYPSEQLGELRSSNDLLGNVAALHERVEIDGYLLFRDFILRDTVIKARHLILKFMDERQR